MIIVCRPFWLEDDACVLMDQAKKLEPCEMARGAILARGDSGLDEDIAVKVGEVDMFEKWRCNMQDMLDVSSEFLEWAKGSVVVN